MNSLTILYDDRCGLCTRLRGWLESQPTFVPLVFMPLHSPDLASQFPGVAAFKPDEKLVVISDDLNVWKGDGAWITLLWALVSGRELALKLASPLLRPMARRIVTMVSQNRLKLSKWLHLKPMPELNCDTGTCAVG